MKGRSRQTYVLAAAGTEEHVRVIRQTIRAVPLAGGQMHIAQAYTISQIRQGVSGVGLEAPADLVIAEMPLRDRTGVEGIVDIAARNPDLQIVLLVRQEAYEQVMYQCRNLQVFVLSLPVRRQVLTEAAAFMIRLKEVLADKDKELMRLRRNLSEITIITRAKIHLMQVRNLDEAEAHYYLEKEAMDRGISKKEVAEEILR